MYCPKCGAEIKDDAKFCSSCGAPVGGQQIESFAQAVRMALDGNEAGYTYLYEETYKSKFYLAIKYMESRESAEDVLQDAYIKAFSKLDTLKEPETFPTWLGTIVANTAKNALQKNNPILFSDLSDETDEGEELDLQIEDESVDVQPEESYLQQENTELLAEMMSSLSEEQRMCILMYHIDGESIRDIAEALGCSENTVKSRLNYGRKNLRAKAEELKKKGYAITGSASIPLLLSLLSTDASAMYVEPSFLSAGQRMEAYILQQIQSLLHGAGAGAAGTGAKAAAGAAGHGFLSTTAGKVILTVIIAAVVAGGIGGGLAVRHNNRVKEEAAREAEEAERDRLIEEAEAGAAEESEAETEEVEKEEPEDVEEEVIPVTDDMYPELLEGGLTKEQFEVILAYAPVPMSNGEVSYNQLRSFLENVTMDCRGRAEPYYNGEAGSSTSYSQEVIGVSGKDREDLNSVVCYDYNLSEMNDFLSVLVEDPGALIASSSTGGEFEPYISGDTFSVPMDSGDYGTRCNASITNAGLSGDTMVVNYTDVSDVYREVVATNDRTAVLKQTETGRYRIDSIMEGTVDIQSYGDIASISNGDYILPDSSSKYLTNDDLAGLSSDELRLARNEIYARHGRKFDDTELQDYFNSKDWYNGTINPDDFAESMLNEYEVANRDLIIAYEEGHESGSSNTGSASSDSANTSVTGSVREIYEQVLKDVQVGKYTFGLSGYEMSDYEDKGFQYFVTDMNGDGIKELIVAKHYFDTNNVGWTGLVDDRYARAFTVTQNGSAYSLKVIDGATSFVDAYYAGDGNKGFYVQNYFNRGNGEMSISLVTISSNALSESDSVKYAPGESGYDQFGTTNPNVTWYDISDYSGLNSL